MSSSMSSFTTSTFSTTVTADTGPPTTPSNPGNDGNGGGNGGGGAFNSIFQSPGGPPLILVCIAAGLLLGAFTGVLVMRRVRPGHALLVHRGADGALRLGPERGPGVGEKPRLVDVHLVGEEGEGDVKGGMGKGKGKGKGRGEEAWRHLSPFAALYLPSSPSTSSRTAPTTTPRTPSSNRFSLRKALPRIRSGPSSSSSPNSSGSNPADSANMGPRHVQLAVAVSLPVPPGSRGGSIHGVGVGAEGGDKDGREVGSAVDDGGAMPDCCIGTVVVAYRPPDPTHAPMHVVPEGGA